MKYITRLERGMIADNVQHIRRRVASACARAGRTAEELTLVAVSKTFDSSQIRRAVEAGVNDIGENFVQELVHKRDELNDLPVRWHFIGHLQTNKVKYIAGWIHLIHSVDSLRLGEEISKYASRVGRVLDVLVEVNTSGEATKYGVNPERTTPLIEELSALPSLRVQGLMTVGPFAEDPEESRSAYRMLRDVAGNARQKGFQLPHLSMGMTNDFEVAIEEGATIVRVGTAIFGKRATKR